MIYTDGTHLVGESIEELHSFAKSVSLKKEWFQDHNKHPHYDLTTVRARNRAIKAGAMEVDSRYIIHLFDRLELIQAIRSGEKRNYALINGCDWLQVRFFAGRYTSSEFRFLVHQLGIAISSPLQEEPVSKRVMFPSAVTSIQPEKCIFREAGSGLVNLIGYHLFEVFGKALDEQYERGKRDGKRLLVGLNSGEIRMSDFENDL